MAILKINGDTSGSVSLTVPAAAGTNTATIPASTGNVLLDSTVGVCRAWVNFNGTGTVAIRASFNVSSITDNGTGDYTVNFTNAISDVNYAKLTGISGSTNASSGLYVSTQLSGITYNSGYTTTTTLRILYANGSGVNVDCADINIGIFR